MGDAWAWFLERFRDSVGGSVFQVTPDAVRNVAEQLVFLENGESVCVRAWIGGCWPAGNDVQTVPDHVRDDEGDDFGLGRLNEPPTFDAR